MLTLLILVLLAGLGHDTVMDQKTPHDSAVLHLLSQVASHLTLECINLHGVMLPVTATKRFSLRGVSETGSDDRIRRLPNITLQRAVGDIDHRFPRILQA
jgi:hypothetical protein